jgi:phenylpropionate dioxygenase-like ring-hydroxylating dioxygenase large terminal subunit
LTTSIGRILADYRPGHALPRAVYCDPEIYEAEIRSLFMRSWLYVGHHSQVPRAGDYFLFEIAGESVIVVRGQDGAINALLNVCRHRGSRICDERTCRTTSTAAVWGCVACRCACSRA